MLPLNLSVQGIQVLDQLFLLGIFSKHGRHVLSQARYDIRMYLKMEAHAVKEQAQKVFLTVLYLG